jgi:hypothetical protein
MTTNLTAEDSVKRIRVSKIEFEGRAPYLPDSRQTESNPEIKLHPGSPSEIADAVSLLTASPGQQVHSLYPEFAQLSLPALIADMRRIVPNQEERDELAGALKGLTGDTFINQRLPNAEKVAGFILREMLPRWRQGNFYYTGCPATNAFC